MVQATSAGGAQLSQNHGNHQIRDCPPDICTCNFSQIVEIVCQLREPVQDWIPKSPTRGEKWKQLFKNNFVHLTQFAEKSTRQQSWKKELSEAARLTVVETCPRWESDQTDRAIYNQIQNELTQKSKRSPRQGWLFEKAYGWLKSLEYSESKRVWYPHHAIRVAHELFLSDSGKFQSFMPAFMKYLNHKSRRRKIADIIHAYKPIIDPPAGLC